MDIKEPEQNTQTLQPLFHNVLFNRFLNCGHLAIMFLTKDGILQYVTPFIASITGITAADCGKSVHSVDFSRQNSDFIESINNFIFHLHDIETSNSNDKWDNLNEYHIEMELNGKNHNSYLMVIRAFLPENNLIGGMILVFYDISSRMNIEEALRAEKEKYRMIAELMDSALWEYNISDRTLKQYRKLKGKYQNETMNITNFRETALANGWIHPEDIPVFEAYCDSMDRGEEIINYDLRAKDDHGEYIWLRYQGVAIKDSFGSTETIMGRTLNIDREYKDHEKLVQKTERDALTGLYNRATTKEKGENYYEGCNLEHLEELSSFMMIDLDNFKQANDQCGHLFGDILLETFASLLENQFSCSDIVGRIGGDEFVVIQKGILTIDQIHQSVKEVCEAARKQMNLKSCDTKITVSVGVSLYPRDGKDYETLCRKADIALYTAKSLGKDQYAFYEPSMEAAKLSENQSTNFIAAEVLEKNVSSIEKRLLNFTFDIVAESPDSVYTIQHILQEIGRYYDLSRITVYRNSSRNIPNGILYEWMNNEVRSLSTYSVKQLKNLKKDYYDKFIQNGVFYFNNIATDNLADGLRNYYEIVGTKSLIECSIYDGNRFVGVIAYEDCISARNWSKTEFDTLFTLTKMLGSIIIQQKNQQVLDSEIFFTQATLDTQKLCNYAVIEGTYQLLYFSEYTKLLYPDVKLGELCYKALYNKEIPCEDCPLRGLVEENKISSVDTYYEQEDAWYSTTASSVTMPDGRKINLICSSDVTSFIERVTSKDNMTGLLTLTKFEVEALKLINSSSSKYMIIYNDFDKFKNINDEWGYATGNELLTLYATVASRFLQPRELFCRITADKFIMMLTYKNKKEALRRVSDSYNAIETEFKAKYPKINAVITSGIYFLKPEDKKISVAIDKANLARKTIKGIHKSEYAIYDEALHRQITKEKLIAGKMYDAMKNEEFVVYMQPKVDLTNFEITGAEALVRWRLPSGEIISPADFIPMFEKNGFIDMLDFYVYDKTLMFMRRWLDLGKREFVVSMNVSRIHLKDAQFELRLQELLDKYRIPNRMIELEITESMFIVEPDRIENVITSLRKRGFHISIDDFGSGYSSLNLLKTLPVDILKLDREFFMKNEMKSQDKIIISSIISLAKGLGLKVISEGIETKEQVTFLQENLCDMAQGYIFHKPMPLEEFEKLLK